MNGLLILLCMVGWALYIVHTNSGGGATAAQNKILAAPPPAAQAAATSIQPQLQPIASAAVQSPHAIMPDETPGRASPSSPVPLPQTQTTENTKALSEAGQELGSGQPEEQLRVTSEASIRSGPSASAELIGRAHAGATLRVKSREAGWVQFVDPVANETGWISMAYLGPADAVGNTPSVVATRSQQPPKAAKLKTAKPIRKTAKLTIPKPMHSKPPPAMRHLPPMYAGFPADHEFVPSRRFGLFLRRRWAEDFTPPPYR
jgi:Bacterial SH3 domain